MKNKIYFLITIICIYTTNAIALNLLPEFLFAKYHAHKAFQNKDYQKTKSILEKEQVQNPNNPYVNYNLGTVFYKLKEYNNAKENFQRATQNFSINNKQFLEQTNFNLGNCFYKNTLVTLGENWEKDRHSSSTSSWLMSPHRIRRRYRETVDSPRARFQAPAIQRLGATPRLPSTRHVTGCSGFCGWSRMATEHGLSRHRSRPGIGILIAIHRALFPSAARLIAPSLLRVRPPVPFCQGIRKNNPP